MRYTYLLYKRVNHAETWRDADNIVTDIIDTFSTKQKAEEALTEIVKDRTSVAQLKHYPVKVKFDKNNEYHYCCIGSWAPTYTIRKQQVK